MKAHGSPASRNSRMGAGSSNAGELKPHAPGMAAAKKISNFSPLGMKSSGSKGSYKGAKC